MNSPVAVFEPIYSSNSFWFYTGLIGSLVLWAALIAILSQKKSKMEYQRRMLLALLFFIAAITTTGMGLFSGWAMMRTGKVSIFADALQVGSRRYPFEQVVKIYTQEAASGRPARRYACGRRSSRFRSGCGGRSPTCRPCPSSPARR